ncbi:MAG: sigma-70 family RNA polymerase sigma factor [Planctomycetota bacterium]|nr:sigma-70 family RNA polymerase sigma factor [Planctomycetota bacterium]
MNTEEAKTIREAQKGSVEAFRMIVESYQKRACWVAYGLIGNYELARDIAQEAFLRVFRALHKFDTNRNFYTWLYQIIVNLCIDHMRKQGGVKHYSFEDLGPVSASGVGREDGSLSPTSRLEKKELSERVHEILAKLPPAYKAVLTLRDIQGLELEEIAEIVGSNNATVRWRLFQARKLFRDMWERRGAEV